MSVQSRDHSISLRLVLRPLCLLRQARCVARSVAPVSEPKEGKTSRDTSSRAEATR